MSLYPKTSPKRPTPCPLCGRLINESPWSVGYNLKRHTRACLRKRVALASATAEARETTG